MKIENSVAIVTGGAQGLGEATVRLLVSLGGSVAIWDINSVQGESLAQELGPKTKFFRVDVTSDDSVKSALAQTLALFKKVTILVNSAGKVHGQMTITSKTVHVLADFESNVRLNLIGLFNVSRLVAQVMQAQAEENKERGVIVHVASIAAYEAQRGQTAYGASKGAVAALTLPMARDLAAYGIRVNSVAPGPFDTKIGENVSEKIKKALTEATLSKRPGNPSEFAHCVKFLIENTYMNGAVVRIDSGIRLPNI